MVSRIERSGARLRPVAEPRPCQCPHEKHPPFASFQRSEKKIPPSGFGLVRFAARHRICRSCAEPRAIDLSAVRQDPLGSQDNGEEISFARALGA